MRACLILCLACLAGCNTPGPGFRGVAAVPVVVGQSRFDVRIDGLWAQAIRRTPEWAPRPAAVIPHAVAAMEGLSGCRVARLGGDQAMMVAQLDCGAGVPPPPVPGFTCQIEELGDGYGDLICLPRR